MGGEKTVIRNLKGLGPSREVTQARVTADLSMLGLLVDVRNSGMLRMIGSE